VAMSTPFSKNADLVGEYVNIEDKATFGFSSAKASLAMRCVVECSRGLATVSSQRRTWMLRSSVAERRAEEEVSREYSGTDARPYP
jgi:hypothetical protein